MVPKRKGSDGRDGIRFRAVLFRMVPKHCVFPSAPFTRFRAVLFRMVPKQMAACHP